MNFIQIIKALCEMLKKEKKKNFISLRNARHELCKPFQKQDHSRSPAKATGLKCKPAAHQN